MLLDHCYAFSLSLLPSGLKKKFLEKGNPRDLFWPRPGSAPGGGGLAEKTTTLVRDHEYFIPTKFHQNQLSGSGEEVEYVESLR